MRGRNSELICEQYQRNRLDVERSFWLQLYFTKSVGRTNGYRYLFAGFKQWNGIRLYSGNRVYDFGYS
jgi:hypothetical protein